MKITFGARHVLIVALSKKNTYLDVVAIKQEMGEKYFARFARMK